MRPACSPSCFFATSIGLALLARLETRPSDIFDTLPGQTEPAAPAPAAPAPVAAPSSAQDVLQQLGGGAATPPATETPATEAPAAPAANQNTGGAPGGRLARPGHHASAGRPGAGTDSRT